MALSHQPRRFTYLGAALAAALAIGAVALPVSSAKAQAWVQLGPFGFGVGGPYYAYPYNPYYPYPYYPGYYYYPRY